MLNSVFAPIVLCCKFIDGKGVLDRFYGGDYQNKNAVIQRLMEKK